MHACTSQQQGPSSYHSSYSSTHEHTAPYNCIDPTSMYKRRPCCLLQLQPADAGTSSLSLSLRIYGSILVSGLVPMCHVYAGW